MDQGLAELDLDQQKKHRSDNIIIQPITLYVHSKTYTFLTTKNQGMRTFTWQE